MERAIVGHSLRRLQWLLGPLVGLALMLPGPTVAQTSAAPVCQFILGFKTLHDLIPAEVGECVDNQAFAANGDALQHTTKGLMVWRKADNWTAFTNGYGTWINGPNGLVKRLNTERFPWEAGQGVAAPSPAVSPAPADLLSRLPQVSDLPQGLTVTHPGIAVTLETGSSQVAPKFPGFLRYALRQFRYPEGSDNPVVLGAAIAQYDSDANAHVATLGFGIGGDMVAIDTGPQGRFGDEGYFSLGSSQGTAEWDTAMLWIRKGSLVYVFAQKGGPDPIDAVVVLAAKFVRPLEQGHAPVASSGPAATLLWIDWYWQTVSPGSAAQISTFPLGYSPAGSVPASIKCTKDIFQIPVWKPRLFLTGFTPNSPAFVEKNGGSFSSCTENLVLTPIRTPVYYDPSSHFDSAGAFEFTETQLLFGSFNLCFSDNAGRRACASFTVPRPAD